MILLDVDKIESKFEEYKEEKNDECLDAIAAEIYNVYTQASSTTLRKIAKQIDENVNFYRGNHYLYYDDAYGKYIPYERTRFNSSLPREVTNYVGTEVDVVTSLLSRSRETFFVVENSNDAEDRNKAKIAEAILEGNYYFNNEALLKIQLVKTSVLCGTAYRKDYWNKDKVITYGNKSYYGETETKILSPLQIIPDYQNSVNDIDEGRYVIEFGFMPVSFIRNSFNSNEEGYTGKASEVKEDNTTNIQLDYLQTLRNPEQIKDTKLKNYTILLCVYLAPSAKNKQGLFIVSTNNKILYINDNKTYNQFGGRFWNPYSMTRYKTDIFSHYGISLPELIIPLNKSINSIDNLVKLNRQTMVSPKVLVPAGSLVAEQEINGMPGQILTTNPGSGEIKFEYGKSLDQSVQQERQQKVSEISKISGVSEILQGIRPTGVSTTSGLSLLTENAYSRFNITSTELENCLQKAYTKVLNLKRHCYTTPRENYYKRILAINNSLTKVAISDFFTGEDLGNNIDVRIEQGTTLPKSTAIEQQNIKEIAQMGVFGSLDPMQNPVGNKYVLSKFGLDKFSTPTNNDTTRAMWENDLIRNKKFQEVQVMPVDNNIIHYKILNEEIKKPDFYDNNSQEVCQYYWKHLCEHFQTMTDIEIQMSEISQTQKNELDIMSINLGVIDEQALTQKRMPPMMPTQEGAIGQSSPNGLVPSPNGQMPNSANNDFFTGEEINQ